MGIAPGPHRPRSHLHLDLSGHLGRGWWGGEWLRGPAGASTAHQPRRKCPGKACQSRLLAQPCLVLGQDKEQWSRLPPLPNRPYQRQEPTMVGVRGKTGRKLASPTQNQSSPAQYFHSHPGRATLGGDTFFPAKMYKLINRHHGAHTPQHDGHTPEIHSSWRAHAVARAGKHTYRSLLPVEPNPSLHLLSATWCGRGEDPTQNLPPRANQTGGRGQAFLA